ncbi:MAG: glycerate kinase [Oscillospiraceae bacterium]|nr:glycerate kinase [Oscillospiraceae bacterium]
MTNTCSERISMRQDALWIIDRSIKENMPDKAVENALKCKDFSGNVILVAVGKAAWQMAYTAKQCLGRKITAGIVLTKYHHVKGPIDGIVCFEGGHPVPDENSIKGTQAALKLVKDLSEKDNVLFLLSGGGSALFEDPLVSLAELQDINRQLLESGADIVEINTIRKRLSRVKGGRFAQSCSPANVFSVILNDVLGNSVDMIASGPACVDTSTSQDAISIVEKYHMQISDKARGLLQCETVKKLDNVECIISGSVHQLCEAAANACMELGYEPLILTDCLCCHASDAGLFLSSVARSHQNHEKPLAIIAGGETTVVLTGNGKGGRNQELVLAAAEGIKGTENIVIFSVGSDGTDGPTDAAGGIVDGFTASAIQGLGYSVHQFLQNNDSYHALELVNGLVFTGPTGTNVNDISVALIRPCTACE